MDTDPCFILYLYYNSQLFMELLVAFVLNHVAFIKQYCGGHSGALSHVGWLQSQPSLRIIVVKPLSPGDLSQIIYTLISSFPSYVQREDSKSSELTE